MGVVADSWFLLQGGSVRAATVVDGLLDSYASHMNSGAAAIETEYMLYGRLSNHIAIHFGRWCPNPWGSCPSCINRHKVFRIPPIVINFFMSHLIAWTPLKTTMGVEL